MDFFRFKLGTVVLANIYPRPTWGHVTGFITSPSGYTHVKIMFENGDEYGVNIELLVTE